MDAYFRENAVNISLGRRWPVLLDPHSIAKVWIQSKEMYSNLTMLRGQDKDFSDRLEHAIVAGHVVLVHQVTPAVVDTLKPIIKAGKASVSACCLRALLPT